jgi:hypothetical protein
MAISLCRAAATYNTFNVQRHLTSARTHEPSGLTIYRSRFKVFRVLALA